MLNINFTPFPNLTTHRLELRQLNINDTSNISLLRSDQRVNEFIDRPVSTTLEDAKKFIEKIENGIVANEWIYWAITLKNHPTLIGTICCWNISAENDMAEIGYELKPEFHGQGIMQEAISKVIAFGFEEIKLKVITALPKKGNDKSIKLLLKNNFKLDTSNKYVNMESADGLLVYYLTPDIK